MGSRRSHDMLFWKVLKRERPPSLEFGIRTLYDWHSVKYDKTDLENGVM